MGKSDLKPDLKTLRWRFRLSRGHIAYVRFVLEAYEGLAQMSSDAGRDEIVWLVAPSQAEAARRLSRALADEVGLARLPDDASDPKH